VSLIECCDSTIVPFFISSSRNSGVSKIIFIKDASSVGESGSKKGQPLPPLKAVCGVRREDGEPRVERFHRSLKEEEVWIDEYQSFDRAQQSIACGSRNIITTVRIADSMAERCTNPVPRSKLKQ